MIVSPSRLSSRESLQYDDEPQFNVHPDPHSSETSPSSPSDINSHPHRSRRPSRSQPPSSKRRSRSRPPTPGNETETSATRTAEDPLPVHRHTHSHSHSSSSTRFLARLIAREDQDTKRMNSLLLITNEKLELETRRANDAENKAAELIRRFKDVVQSRDAALQDAARANEELRLYKVQLETAQREIFRAQAIIDRVASEKLDAEEEAARARTKARQLQEEKLVNNARDEGRRLGFQEGLSRGRRIGFQEGREAGLESRPRGGGGIGEYTVDEDNILSPDPIVMPRSPLPESIEIRVASPPLRRTKTPQPARPSSKGRSRSNTWDTAPHAPTLPFPTVTTPLTVPSVSRAPNPSRESNRTPVPVPIPAPPRSPDSIRPRSVRNNISSPVPRHPSAIPRDGFIPETDRNSNFINIPPPHELSFPVPPSPSPSNQEPLPRPPPKDDRYTTNAYDHAYPSGSGPGPGLPIGFGTRTRTGSIGSRNSTRISQYDLVSPPREEPNYYKPRDQGRRTPAHEDEQSPTQIADNWRSRNPDMVKPSRSRSNSAAANNQRGNGSGSGELPPRSRMPAVPVPPQQPPQTIIPQQHQKQPQQGTKSPLNFLFRRNLLNRARTYSSPPEILIEPPSGSPSDHSLGTIAHPHLLTPEDANRELPLPGDEELNEFLEANENIQPPMTAYRGTPFIPNDYQLPAGFVPLSGPTTVMMAPRIDSPRFTDLCGGMPAGLAYPKSNSASGSGSRPSTAFELERSKSPPTPTPPGRMASPSLSGAASRFRRRLFSMGASSPAPLQRPISIFSEDS